MLKRSFMVALTMSAIMLTACSGGSKSDIVIDETGAVLIGGTPMMMDTYTGHSGTKLYSDGASVIQLNLHDSFGSCEANAMGVTESNISEDGDFTYFTGYNGTYTTVHRKTGEGLMCASVYIAQPGVDGNTVLKELESLLTGYEMTMNPTIDIMGKIKSVDGVTFTVNNKGQVVFGDNQVAVYQGTMQTTSQTVIGDKTLGKITDGYDYYTYDGLIIKAQQGADITQFIELL